MGIVEIQSLTKRFKEFVAVDGIDLSVSDREIFALLGPNGAGKTTTIKMLITLLSPSAGTSLVCGYDIVKEPAAVRRLIGYVPQMLSVDGTLTAYENLMLMARLYDIPRRQRAERVQETLSFVRLEPQAHALVRTFSGGMIRRLEVGQAVIHRPRVLFLDEPTAGLDPIAKRSIWEHLEDLRSNLDTTIFFSTHNMEEATDHCGRIAIMNTGKIAAIGTVEDLTEKTGKSGADLEDAFVYFTGSALRETSSFRETRRTRQKQRRLG